MISYFYYICLIIFFMAGFVLGAYLLLSLMADKRPKEKKIKKEKQRNNKMKDREIVNYSTSPSMSVSDEELSFMNEDEQYDAVESKRKEQTEAYNYAEHQS